MIVALLALFVAMGGAGYAAFKLPKNSVGAKQIKRNAVNSSKVADGSLLAGDFRPGQLPAGPQGLQGLQGIQGLKGEKGDSCLPSDPACTGPKGDTGPQGPGAMSFEGHIGIDAGNTDITTINGVRLGIFCAIGGKVNVFVQRVSTSVDFGAWGIQSVDGGPPTRGTLDLGLGDGKPERINAQGNNEAQLDVVAKGNLPGEPAKWTRFDIFGVRGGQCNYHALVIPPG
jgi:hypothetical protein